MAQGTVQQPANAPTTLHDAVKGAFKEHVGEGDIALGVDEVTGDVVKKENADEKPEVKEPAKAAPATEEAEETFEIDATQEEIGNALALHRGLADPKTRPSIIQQLYDKAGLKAPTTKTEVKQAADDIDSILREALGETYDVMSGDRLKIAFERYGESILKKLEAQLSPVQERLRMAEERTHQEEANAALASLWERHKVPQTERAKVSDAMMKKMKQFSPGEGVNASEYLDSMFSLAQRDVEKARAVKTVVKRIQQNATDVRETSGDGGSDDKRIKTGSRLPSISESVAAAWRGETLEE